MKEAIEDYLHFLRIEKQLAENTLIAYRTDLETYAEDLKEWGMTSWQEVKRDTISQHLRKQKEAGKE